MDLRDEINAFYYSTALCDLRMMNRNLVDETLTYNSLLYLELIQSMRGKCTASRIADLLHISRPGVTEKINELIRQNLVIKTPDPEDHRRNLLSVNEETVPRSRICREQDERAVRTLAENFSEEDVQKFCRMLRILTEINYEEIE